MLSLIICSRKHNISEELEKNIAETIGCEYELVVIDNSKNQYSIFSAYNEGVRQSKGNNLCFMHDDLWYRTLNWGSEVEKFIAETKDIGVVGVLGAYCLTKNHGYWDMMKPYVTGRAPVGNNKDWEDVNNGDFYYGKDCSQEVVAVDGMWFCIPRKLFERIKFDEETYSGYHFYDMDICMQSLCAGYKNAVIRDIEILHMCHPQYNYLFSLSMKKFCKKWDHELPIFRGEAINMDEKNYRRLYDTVKQYCSLLEKYNFYKEDVENSLSFRLGNAIAEPYRILLRFIRKHKKS